MGLGFVFVDVLVVVMDDSYGGREERKEWDLGLSE